MSWSYRIVQSGDQFAVHEVFFSEDGSVEGWTEQPVFPRGDSLEELREDLARYLHAFEQPPFVESEGKLRERG
ncbi:MAG TPA: hypothetical protein VF701_08380 [Thermoanaerobaculia bacterium]